ncbi:MAG TPA: integrase core domain-containing protein [Burkholderiales bacterium]|nr:integrase core domain-containing protein [Burkholderiales bacterium]
MRVQYVGYGVKGFYRMASLALKEACMDETAYHRKRVLDFWGKHGLDATLDAFKVSRRTLYAWRRAFLSSGSLADLCPRSRAPRQKREPEWDKRLIPEIRRLRIQQPNLGKEKLFVMLQPFCTTHHVALPSVSTIGRIIAKEPGKMRFSPLRLGARGQVKRINRVPVSRKPKGLKLQACECLAFDTIIRQRDGVKRHILTAIDPVSEVAFAYAPPRGGRFHAASFNQAIRETHPLFKHAKALTDNGSEFKGAFSRHHLEQGLTHWHTYPKTPKMNAHCERFNRSLQESFVDYHEDLLFTDLALFNEKLADWIVFYNTQLPHLSTKPNPKKTTSKDNMPMPPIQYLLKLNPQCNM